MVFNLSIPIAAVLKTAVVHTMFLLLFYACALLGTFTIIEFAMLFIINVVVVLLPDLQK